MAHQEKIQISEAQIHTYEEDGVLFLPGLLDEAWVARLQTAVDRVMAQPSARGGDFNNEKDTGRFFGDLWMWRFDEDFRALAFDSTLPAVASQLMRSSKVNLHWDQLLVKEAHTPLESPWHQDQPYAWADGEQNSSFWVSLDTVTLEKGSVEFIRGSHKGTWYQAKSFFPDRKYESNDFEPLPDIEGNRDDYDIVHFETNPGDVVVHHLNILHHAPGNNTNMRRRATAVRFSGDDATFVQRRNGPPLLQDPGIPQGAAMDSDLFPVVYQTS